MVVSRSADRNPRQREAEDSLAQAACAAGARVILTPHLYHLRETSPVWEDLRKLTGTIWFASWLYPRPFEWLLRHHGIAVDGERILQLTDGADTKEWTKRICESGTDRLEPSTPREISESFSSRWYPVIDGSRCVNCQHCLQFCLFTVYELDPKDRVTVTNPDQCKPGCPACSRICPHSAIIFPIYDKDEAIAGAPGKLVTFDAAARRAFYVRTGQVCPACGKAGEENLTVPPETDPKDCCPECGRLRALPSTSDGVLGEIDDLINRLEKLSEEEGR
jgi:Pyruvate/2-oxoacid:ferredoxin oxidoreductase delta subunit